MGTEILVSTPEGRRFRWGMTLFHEWKSMADVRWWCIVCRESVRFCCLCSDGTHNHAAYLLLAACSHAAAAWEQLTKTVPVDGWGTISLTGAYEIPYPHWANYYALVAELPDTMRRADLGQSAYPRILTLEEAGYGRES